MSFWNNVKEKISDANDSLQKNIGQFKNKKFADASMAICALVAAADGDIDADERKKTAGFIVSNESLKVFSASDLKEKFDFYCNKLEADYDFGKIEAIQALSVLKGKPDQARACIQLGIIIGGADGDFDADEKRAIKDACNAVGIPASEFDL
ncbi:MULTISPECIES: TerB family tellurite resistance protein [Pseudoalteromonas]|uniref:tellurite resistance TerB family protein n=2 Tax=Pseudoalteromonas TaxID=53246 RepID=UPI0025B60FA4|nr:TerB family tellurite resistance protein [Pseudoalteromonas sp. APC 3691]MDN3390348.1 TerB family tellurite resistance protein [Pseudoalteromonas sp. APC 3691]